MQRFWRWCIGFGLLIGLCAADAHAAVPVAGFQPMVGIALTTEFDNNFSNFVVPKTSPAGATFLGTGGVANYDLALLDTGAAVSLITNSAYSGFRINGPYSGQTDGFRGTVTQTLGGATGFIDATIGDPLGLYAGGVQNRTGGASFAMPNSALRGQTNTSIVYLPAESDLPNVLGLPFASQYATYIRNDLPQIFTKEGRTVRTPSIEFNPLGSGGQGIVRRAPLTLNPGSSFTTPPAFIQNFNFNLDKPYEDPSVPTIRQGALYVNVGLNNQSQSFNTQFFFDTGADTTVISELTAALLGIDPVLTEPDFVIAVVGSGGTLQDVPGFFVESLKVATVGGTFSVTNVPVIVLDVTNPGDPGNVVPGIIGTNVFAGRNLVIDPNPAVGGGGLSPRLYISDPVTTSFNWATVAATGSWAGAANWSGSAVPGQLGIANVNHTSGSAQTAVVSTNSQVWEVNIAGGASAPQTIAVQVDSGATLTTFSGVNLFDRGELKLNGGKVDAQFVEVFGGGISGAGAIEVGNGPIAGQIENRQGTVAPGNGVGALNIIGRFANGVDGTIQMEIGGAASFDQLIVTGEASLQGTFELSLLGGFVPAIGAPFSLITATKGVSGEFDILKLPTKYYWNTTYNANSVVLSVLANAIAGDFNGDRTVDAADYTLWRDGLGTLYTAADYNVWRNNFGQVYSAVVAAGVVPEPASLVLVIGAVAMLVKRRK